MSVVLLPDDIRDDALALWHRYVDVLAPLRPELHRYCRRLTGDTWDGEDLLQDTILRGFGSLGMAQARVENPRAYLVRIATNLWIDAVRRRTAEGAAFAAQQQAIDVRSPVDPEGIRDAAGVLFVHLSPQERAAVLMKDVLDFSLKETAEVLSTTPNAIKSALHRGRERIRQVREETLEPRNPVSAALVDRFVDRLNASDLQGLLALMLDGGAVEMRGDLVEVGREQFAKTGSWLWQSVNVHPDLPPESRPPKFLNERVVFRGEPLIMSYLIVQSRKLLTSVTRLEEDDGCVARVRSYLFCPETVAEVGAELGLDVAPLPYRFPTPTAAKRDAS
jgi:RNA polymerase sigma-70 factor (ECF subfamily)